MTSDEADKLVDDFIEQFKIEDSIGVNFDVYQINKLPCSSGKLKYAHFILAEYLVKNGKLNKHMGDLLIKSYAFISRFLDDEKSKIDTINSQNTEYSENLKKGDFYSTPELNDLILTLLAGEIEFNNFIAECQLQYSK